MSRDWRAQLEAKKVLLRNLRFFLGVSVPCFIAGLALWIGGVFGTFWFWTIHYATQYGSRVGVGQGLQILAERFWITMGTAWPIWAMAALGLIACLLVPAVRMRAGFLVTFAFFSALAVCPGFYFRPHYFILVLPAVSLLAAAAVVAAFEAFKHLQTGTRFGVVGLFAACLAWPLWSERDLFFERQLEKANRMVNGANPFPESVKIGEYIREQSAPSDTIAVLGSEPQIYFYAQRRSATGYIYTYSLMETQPYAHQM